MAAITERMGRFLARVRRDGFKSVAKTFTRRADATAWARRVEADMEAGRWVEAGDATPTLGEAIDAYRVAVADRLKGGPTYAYWFDELKGADLAKKPVDGVTPFDIAKWRDEQASRLQPGTVARKMGLLSGLLTWCKNERGWIACNPMCNVTKPRVSDARDRTLTEDELRYLQGAAATSRADWLGPVLVILLRSAMRRGELWGLQRGDVDFAGSVAHLADTKNGTARDVPLCPQALQALRTLADGASARGETALVPVTDPHAVSLAFRRTVARARVVYERDHAKAETAADRSFLADLRLHDLRHCAVSTWASTGALSMVELMAISGHKTPRMLTRYAHLSASTVASKMAAIAA